MAPFWFLEALFFTHVLYCLFSRYASSMAFLIACVALRGCEELFMFHALLAQICSFALFYAFGAFAAEQLRDWPEQCEYPLALSLVAASACTFFALAAWNHGEAVIAGKVLDISILPATICGIIAVFLLSGVSRFQSSTLITYLGKHSLPLLLMHILFVAGTRIALIKFMAVGQPLIVLAAAFSMGIIGPLCVHGVASKLRLAGKLGLE